MWLHFLWLWLWASRRGNRIVTTLATAGPNRLQACYSELQCNRILGVVSDRINTSTTIILFKSYCTLFYCCYLWTAYKKSTFDRLRVAFNNTYRCVLTQPWRCSASAMYANFGINNFETTIRKSTYGFIQRLAKSTNSLIMTIEKFSVVRIDIWNFWQKTLYIAPPTWILDNRCIFLNIIISSIFWSSFIYYLYIHYGISQQYLFLIIYM